MLYVRSRWPTLRHGLGHDLGRFKQPPDHLGEPECEIWDDVIRDFKGSRASYFVLLSWLEAHMRARQARETIDDEGMTIIGRDGQPKAHPLCTVERDARRAFQQTFRSLGIKL